MASLQEKVKAWIKEINLLDEKQNNSNSSYYNFKIEGFANEPVVYIHNTSVGFEFGYNGVQWNGHTPVETKVKRLVLSWNNLKLLSSVEREDKILELMIKTIKIRKRQYQKCQYCQEKVAIEHRYDMNTCHSCATEHLNIIY